MKRSRFTEKQSSYVLKLAEQGQPVKDVCRQYGIAEATFYAGRKKHAGLGSIELCEWGLLREENGRLKKLVADLSIDKHVLTEVVKENI